MSDVSTITTAIMAAARTGKYATEVNAIWGVGIKLLQDVDTNHKPEWEKKEQISLITIGALVAGLALQRSKCEGQPDHSISENEDSEFYCVPYYPLTWKALLDACGMPALVASYDRSAPEFRYFSKENPIYPNLIMRTGKGIMDGNLPFYSKQLKAIFPDLATEFDAMDNQIKKQSQYRLIEEEFAKTARAMQSITHPTSTQQTLSKQFMALKENTLLSFKKGDEGFDFDGCMTIAKSGVPLAVKISTNEVTPKDLHRFNQATQPFQTSKWLATLVAAIIGVASGMVIGFFAGGLPGMIAGAIVGGVTAVSCTMWHTRKKAPLVQISNQCKGIVNKADQPSDGAVMKPLASI